MTTPEYFTQAKQQTASDDFNAIAFVCTQLINKLCTIAVVRVEKVINNGEVAPAGTVSVLVLTNQLSGDGQAVPHQAIVNVPYFRLQGGSNAVILDPKVGDLGLCAFAMRDISAVKTAKGPANPGSNRKYNWADGLYVGGFLNGSPSQYVQFTDRGLNLVSPAEITLQAPTIRLVGAVDQTAGDVTMSQKLSVVDVIHSDTDVTSDNISGKTHTHNDPQGGVVGPPNP